MQPDKFNGCSTGPVKTAALAKAATTRKLYKSNGGVQIVASRKINLDKNFNGIS
jgi:hypothetical protein